MNQYLLNKDNIMPSLKDGTASQSQHKEDKWYKYRNKIRFFISNIIIFIGLNLFFERIQIDTIGDPISLSVSIILLINGAILSIKWAKEYFISD